MGQNELSFSRWRVAHKITSSEFQSAWRGFVIYISNSDWLVDKSVHLYSYNASLFYTVIGQYAHFLRISDISRSLNFSRLLLSLVSGDRRLKALGDNAVQWRHYPKTR